MNCHYCGRECFGQDVASACWVFCSIECAWAFNEAIESDPVNIELEINCEGLGDE